MENLRRIRKARGLTMKELGKLSDVSESTIGMVETGKRKPSFELLLKLSEALGCSVNDLVDTKKDPATISDGAILFSEQDRRLIEWFRSLPEEKQKAILIAQDAPEGLT